MRFRIVTTTVLLTLAAACSDQITEVGPDRASPAPDGAISFATSESGDGLSITTDKDDYAPGDTVWFTGAGWPANDVLDIMLTEEPLTDPPQGWTVNVANDGTFRDSTYVVGAGDLDVTFTLVATSTSTGRSLTVVFTDGNLQLQPNPTPDPFSPNADGVNETTLITYRNQGMGTENDIQISIRAGTANTGAQVRSFGTFSLTQSTSGTVTWDGKNTGGAVVAEGEYGIRVFNPGQTEATASGQRLYIALVDTTPAVISIPAVSPTSVTQGVSTPVTLTGRATDNPVTGVSVNRYVPVSAQYSVDGGTFTAMTLSNGSANNVKNLNATIPGTTVLALSSGPHLVCIRATDNAGNTSPNVVTGNTNCATLQVNTIATTTQVVSSLNPSNVGQAVTFTASVTRGSPAVAVTSGSVTFKDGSCAAGTALGDPAALNASGQASITTSSLTAGSHTISACYGGSGAFGASENSVTQEVKAATSLALISSNNPSAVGQSVTFTASVTTGSPAAAVTTGTVTFREGTCAAGSILAGPTALDGSGQAQFSTSSLGLGSHTIRGCYGGTQNLQANEGTVTQVVNNTATEIDLVSSDNPSVTGQSVTFTATVTNNSHPVTTGQLSFKKGGTGCSNGIEVQAPQTPNGSGKVTYSASLAASESPVTIRACYRGSTTPTLQASEASLVQNIGKASTTTSVAAAPNPSVFSQSVTFTATVAVVAPGAGPATGNVTFEEGGTACGNGTDVLATKALAGGQASFSTVDLAAGAHTIRACYAETGDFKTSSNSLNQTVEKASTTTAITSTANPSVFSQSVTFDVTVSKVAPATATPTGNVTFEEGGTACGNGTDVLATKTLVSGQASFSTPDLAVGSHTIRACYAETANFKSSSKSLDQTVEKASTTTAISSTANPSVFSQSVTFDVTVSKVAPATATPTGDVTFEKGGTACGSGTDVLATKTLVAGQASFSTSTLAVAPHTIRACYAETANFKSSNNSLVQTVDQATTKTAVLPSPNPSILAQPVTFDVTVSSEAPAVATPDGNVTLKDGACTGGTTIGGPTALSGGQASFNVSTLAAGTHTITACYAGNTNFKVSDKSLSQQVKYVFEGLFAPVDRPNTMNVSKAGQAIPLKWRLTNFNGAPVLDFTAAALGVAVSAMSCDVGAALDQIEEYAGSSGLQNLGNGYYQFNWKTPTGYANSCKQIGLNLGEGTPLRGPLANFNFKK